MINISKNLSLKFFFPFDFSAGIFNMYFIKQLFSIYYYKNFFKFKYQLLTKGYADCDTWNIDCTMCYLNVRMLKDFRDYSCSPERRSHLIPILNQIIEGFEANYKTIMESDHDDEFTTETRREWIAKQQDLFKVGMKLYAEHFNEFWD